MKRTKYPRTRHLPGSKSKTDDDKVATEEEVASALSGQRVIITEKMDGESTTIYPDGYSHARSVDSKYHPSRTMIRELAARVGPLLPPTYRLCGENIYAEHSIRYESLEAYFQLISIWDGNICLSWEETQVWAELLEIPTVPVIHDGLWHGEREAHKLWSNYKTMQLAESQESEGFVVRLADSFSYEDFGNSVFKEVRPHHVQTDGHWAHGMVKPNGLKQA